MNKFWLVLLLFSGLLFIGCGDKAKELKDAVDIMKDAPEIARNIEKGIQEAQRVREERRKNGDTLALHFTKIQEFLPKTIATYEPAKPEGETINMGPLSFSQARITYTKELPDERQAFIEIDITDYNQAADLYAGLVYWSHDINIESSTGYEKTFKHNEEYVFGFEKYDTQDKMAEITLSVAYRFLVQIRANHQDNTDFVKKVSEQIDIKKLSSL